MPSMTFDPYNQKHIDAMIHPDEQREEDKNEVALWSVLYNKRPSEIYPDLETIRHDLKDGNSIASQRLEDLGVLWKDGVRRGEVSKDLSLAYTDYMWNPNEENQLRVNELEEQIKLIPEHAEADDMLSKFVKLTGGQVHNFGQILKGGAYRGLQGAIAGAAVGGLAGAPTGPGAAVTATGGAVLGATAGFTAGMAEESMRIISGDSYRQLRQMGFEHEHCKVAATCVGIAGGIIEISGMRLPGSWGVIAARVPGLSKLVTKAGQQSAKQASKRIVAFGQAVKQGLVDIAREDAEEIAQEMVQISAEEFLMAWENQYEAYRRRAITPEQIIGRDEFIGLGERMFMYGERLWNTAKESAYAVTGMVAPGAIIQGGIQVGGAGRAQRQELEAVPVEIPEFTDSESVDAFTARDDIDESVIPQLIEERDRLVGVYTKQTKEGQSASERMKTGLKIQFQNEAIGNLDGTYDSFQLPRSRVAKKKNVVDKLIGTLRDQTGAITVIDGLEGMKPEEAKALRESLLNKKNQIVKKAGGADRVYGFLKSEGVPAALAQNIQNFAKSEKEYPFQYGTRVSGNRALKYKGLANGADWYRNLGLDEFLVDEKPQESVKFFTLLSATSRIADPLTNMYNVRRIWQAYKEGRQKAEVVKLGGLVPPEELEGILYGNKGIQWAEDLIGQEEGQVKLRDFVNTLSMAYKDPELLNEYAHAVIDFRMGQYFYNIDAVPNNIKRERAKREIIAIRDYLRKTDDPAYWTSDRVQAALWHWVKDDRVKKGLDPQTEHMTFEQAKIRLAANHFGIEDSKVTKSMINSWVKTQITGTGWKIFDHYRKKGSDWTVLDPEHQGQGRSGREWHRQIDKGKDRPLFIHMYLGRVKPEREFWNDERTRVIMKSDRIYDYSRDPLGIRAKYPIVDKVDQRIIGDMERKLIANGYAGFTAGGVVVFYSPVHVFPMKGYQLSISPSAADEVIEQAQKNGEQETAQMLTRIKRMTESGYQEDLDNYVKEDLVNILDSSLTDPLRVEVAQGRWLGDHELALDGFVEAGDQTVLRGRVAKYLKRYGQKEGYMSKYRSSTDNKRPDSISKGQAPSYVFHFERALDTAELELLSEHLDRFGIGGSTYIPKTNSIIIHHIMKYGQSIKAFKAAIEKTLYEATQSNLSNKSLPIPQVSSHWFEHTMLEDINYDSFIKAGEKREAELGFRGLQETFKVEPESLPEYFQKRGDYAGNWQPVATTKERKIGRVTHTLADFEMINEVLTGDKVYVLSEGFATHYLQEWMSDGEHVKVNTKWDLSGDEKVFNVNELTRYAPGFFTKLIRQAGKKAREALTSERGSVEVRKPTGVYKDLKDSKLVDKRGNLIPVFHGTKAGLLEEPKIFKLKEMEPSVGGLVGPGIYFTPDPQYANLYAGQGGYAGSRVIPVFLDAKKPFKTDKRHMAWVDENVSEGAAFIDKLKAQGYDSVFLHDSSGNLVEVNVFNTSQIHSVFKQGPEAGISLRSQQGGVWVESRLLKRLRKKEPGIIELTEPVTTKERISAALGKKKLTEFMVTEEEALQAGMKKAEQAARKAFIAGRKEGIDLSGVRVETLKGKQKERIAKLKAVFDDYKQRQRDIKDAAKARKKVNKMLTGLEKIKKKTNRLPDPWKSQVESFFGEWDTRNMTAANKLHLEALRTSLESSNLVDLPEKVFDDLKRLEKKSLRDLTIDDLTSVYQGVMHLYTLGAMEREITVGGQKVLVKQYEKEILNEMKPRDTILDEVHDATPSKFKIGKRWENLKTTFGFRQINYDTLIELMSSNTSRFYDVLSRQIKKGRRVQTNYTQKVMDTFWKKLDQVGFITKHKVKNIEAWKKQVVKVEGGLTLTRDQRMSLYRHSMNEDNWKAVTEAGLGFKDAKNLKPDDNIANTFTDKDTWVEALEATLGSLTNAELEFAGAPVTALFDKQGRDLAEVHRQTLGYELELERNYYPKDTMPMAYSAHDFQSKSLIDEFQNRHTRVGVDKGMLHSRLRVQVPIYLNGLTEDIARSVSRAANYIGFEMPMRNAFKVLHDLRYEIVSRYGDHYYREIDKGLRDVIGEHVATDSADKFLKHMRLSVTTATLGLNPWVMLKQAVSFPLYWRFIKPQYLARGMYNWHCHSKDVNSRHEIWSPHWTERKGGFNRDIAELIDKKSNPKKFFRGAKGLREHIMRGIQWFDKHAVGPGMEASVLQALDELNSGKLSNQLKGALGINETHLEGMTVPDKYRLAYEFAEWTTSKTQPMMSPEHRSSLSRGGEWVRLWTMYSSFTNNALNLMVRDFVNMKKKPSKENIQGFAKTMLLLLAINPAGIMIINSLRDKWYDREEKKNLFARWFNSVAGYVYFLRDIVPSMTAKMTGGYTFGFGTPVQSLVDGVTGSLTEMAGYVATVGENTVKAQKHWERMWKHIVRSAEMLTGLPYTNVKKMAPGDRGGWE